MFFQLPPKDSMFSSFYSTLLFYKCDVFLQYQQEHVELKLLEEIHGKNMNKVKNLVVDTTAFIENVQLIVSRYEIQLENINFNE